MAKDKQNEDWSKGLELPVSSLAHFIASELATKASFDLKGKLKVEIMSTEYSAMSFDKTRNLADIRLLVRWDKEEL